MHGAASMKVILENQEYKNISQAISDALYAFQELQVDYDAKYTDDKFTVHDWLRNNDFDVTTEKLLELFAAVNTIKANFE